MKRSGYILFSLMILVYFTARSVQAEEKTGYGIKFASTFFIEHFSDMLYNDVRT